jgi:prepilin-type N-terminal cleavage/methylation domain-containing protein
MALKRSYKGNTLPEVLVALAITSFCATLAVVIYVNIQKSTLPFIRVKAGELAQKYLQEALERKDYFDNAYTEEEYSIKKTVSRSAAFYDCMTISIKVFDTDKKLLTELNAVTPAR